MCDGVQRERRDGESMPRVGEATGARAVRDGDRFERDEQREYRPQAGDTKRWELESRNGPGLRRRNHIGHSTTCRSDHWSSVLVTVLEKIEVSHIRPPSANDHPSLRREVMDAQVQ